MGSSRTGMNERRVVLGAVLLSAAFAVSSAESPEGIAPKWSTDALVVKTVSQIDVALRRAFETPFSANVDAQEGRRKVAVDSCLAWLDWRKSVVGTEPESDFAALRSEGVQCEALSLVKAARTARSSALPADLATMTDARLYPATLWVAVGNEDVERLATPGLSLAVASGISRWNAGRRGLVLEDETEGVRLVWLARADFDGDGWEDALYRWQAWVRGGTWTDMRLVVLTRRRTGEALVEVPAMPNSADRKR